MKQWYKSKINWVAIIMILVSLQDYITNFNFADMTIKGWVMFAMGIVILVLRIYFTNTQIGKPDAPAGGNG